MRLAQQIRIRPVGDDFAFASIVVDGWSVHGIKVNGRRYPIVTPSPAIRNALEGEILAAYRRVRAR